MTPEELRYYRNLLTIEVDDTVEWCIRPYTNSGFLRGTVAAIFSNGKGQYTGMANAFITVNVQMVRCSVSLLNPTLKKLETDK